MHHQTDIHVGVVSGLRASAPFWHLLQTGGRYGPILCLYGLMPAAGATVNDPERTGRRCRRLPRRGLQRCGVYRNCDGGPADSPAQNAPPGCELGLDDIRASCISLVQHQSIR